MSDAYVECLVEGKVSAGLKFLKYLLIAITCVFVLIGLVQMIFLFGAIATGAGAYFISIYSETEFEYLYLDKEITIDKVFSKQKRKRVGVFALDKIEIIAPVNSWHLDSFKNRTFKELDVSGGAGKQPDKRYLFYYNGEKKVIFEPNEEMIKMLRNAAPRKVFTD